MRVVVSLASTVTDQEWQLAGDWLILESSSGSCLVKFDSSAGDPIDISIVRTIKRTFRRLYITVPTAISGGTCVFYVFTEAEAKAIVTAMPVVVAVDNVGLAKDATVAGVTSDSVKGLLRSLGDAGASPANIAGNTLLNYHCLMRSYGLIDPLFSLQTTTILAASAIFTGSTVDLSTYGFGQITAFALSDQSGTLYVDFCDDGLFTNFKSISAALTGGADATITTRIFGRYFRVRYVNGGTAQTRFSLSKRHMVA